MNEPERNWGLIERAIAAGWIDPGHTETLTETARRAAEYLDQRSPQAASAGGSNA